MALKGNNQRPVMFDIDGVLADFIYGFTTICRRLDPDFPLMTNGRARDGVKEQHWYSPWEIPGWPYGTEVVDTAWDIVKHSPHFWEELPALVTPEVFERIGRLGEQRQVYFVTSRVGKRVWQQTKSWLLERIIYTDPMLIVAHRKGQIALGLDAEWCLEDKAGTAVYVGYESPNTHSVLIDRPYNKFEPIVLGSKVLRIKTVDEYLDMIEAQ